MSATFNWTITAMDCLSQSQGNADVVIIAHWNCFGEESGQSSNVYGTCSIPYTGNSFTPYEQLTQNQVLGWVWSNGVNQSETEQMVQSTLNNLISPPVITPPLPWSQ